MSSYDRTIGTNIPKPQSGGGRTLAALLVTHSVRSCGARVACGRLPTAPSSPARDRTSHLPSLVGRVFGLPSVALVAPDSLARAPRGQGPLAGTRHRDSYY
ncbi:hypothetical protein [Halorubrum sp. SD690R]|uniref:hypothetical protein n=1 Tax=Halorubrum sp. SD690R TaxID=2518117 RepID=UPI0010F465DC|nr:hypothetical protein [Halorubrum sp. SD690R]